MMRILRPMGTPAVSYDAAGRPGNMGGRPAPRGERGVAPGGEELRGRNYLALDVSSLTFCFLAWECLAFAVVVGALVVLAARAGPAIRPSATKEAMSGLFMCYSPGAGTSPVES